MNGQQFQDWRTGMGWSQAQAAAALEVSKRTVIDWEAGATAINANAVATCMLLKVARRRAAAEFADDAETAALFTMAEGRIAAADAMPGRGRPRAAGSQ